MTDNYIKIWIPGESMWATRISENSAKVCNIPIMTNEFTLGDLVEIDSENQVVGVLERGAYNMVCHYEASDADQVSERYKQLREYYQGFDIKVEGGVKGICMLSVPVDCDPKQLAQISKGCPVSVELHEPEPME
tara:strand:- start:1469 stop:1870 length:402 start_codon:yes stop_codon:yes gene_type:complete